MKKFIRRFGCFVFVVLILAACFPFSAYAVDPVSAGVMANAFAQAIAAYGASNGVAMTFDVTNTNSIGESVHELWKSFRNGTQTADDWGTLAAALFPDLYYKASVAVGTAADVYTVGYNISSEYAEEFDHFFNWLLSGPAEMVKVDNEYYQFASAQIGSNAVPLTVYFGGAPASVPFVDSDASWANAYASSTYAFTRSNGLIYRISVSDSSTYFASEVVCAYYKSSNSDNYFVGFGAADTFRSYTIQYNPDNNTYTGFSSNSSNDSIYHIQFATNGTAFAFSDYNSSIPFYESEDDARQAFADYFAGLLVGDTLGVRAYDNTGRASFPDTTDPNYDAVAKQIPSDIPWDDTAYGDGTGALSDAQSQAIAAEGDLAIAEDGILTLADTATPGPGDDDDDDDDPTSDDPDDYLAVGLEDIFPFCIPFDIYNFLSALAAEPVAPHFTATLDFPEAVGGTQTIDLDFDSPTWNQLAQLLRILELLAFIVGLALLTRSMFIRG